MWHLDIQKYEGEGDPGGGGGVVSLFLILQYTNEPISVKCLASFLLLTKHKQVSTCSWGKWRAVMSHTKRWVGDLIIVVNHHRQKGMGDMGLLTCQMSAWTSIENVKTSILQQYQRLFKLFSLQSSLTEYQTYGNNNVKKSGLRNGVSGKSKQQGAKRVNDLHLGCCLANNVLLIGVYQSMTEIQMTNGSVVIAWGWIHHESCNTMGYNTTFLLCFITVILTIAEKIFRTPPLSP